MYQIGALKFVLSSLGRISDLIWVSFTYSSADFLI